jgi:ATP-dependent DNA helicase RecG
MNLQSHITSGGRIYKMYASRLAKLGIETFSDFLFHLPSRYEDFSVVSKIGEVQIGETVTVQGNVVDIKNTYVSRGRIKSMQKAIIADDTGSLQLSWFNQPYLTKNITINSTISASGQIRRSGSRVSIVAPTFEVLLNNDTGNIHTGRLIPVYPETQGVSSKWLRRQVYNIIAEHKEELEEYLPEKLLKKQHFMPLQKAIETIHFPANLEIAEKARERLAFEEFFLMQLASLKRKAEWKQETKTKPYKIPKKVIEEAIGTLPFTLTGAQQKAIDDILGDFAKDKPMNRLVQGDVGSGKTVIAAIAMYAAHLNGYQSVLMAPTEILATQHYKSIAKFLEPLGVRVELVTGTKKLTKPPTEYSILIGTHAVLSDKVKFDNLGLVIIDEQQRFGVSQRGLIKSKGNNPHLLTMTATPIPRTVALTMYGDLDLSYLNEMPGGRKKVKTWVVPPEKRDGAYEWIRKQIKETDSQVFIVCPFIEPSETMMTIKAVNHEYERLRKDVYPDLKLGLLHGKLKAKEKDDVLKRFREKEFDILVATPVVEVGIDIPNATVIVIEASERFGLAQLHQLRGRVGRGDKQSYCLLFTDSKQALTSQRLKGMETIYSGAELAELDLKLRGPGNLYGTAQHGVPKLKVASFADAELIQRARIAAQEVFPDLKKYPLLEKRLDAVTQETVTPD